MKKLAAVGLILATMTSVGSCAPHDRFRYECQDPANSEAPPCQIPACQASRTCPDLLDPREGTP